MSSEVHLDQESLLQPDQLDEGTSYGTGGPITPLHNAQRVMKSQHSYAAIRKKGSLRRGRRRMGGQSVHESYLGWLLRDNRLNVELISNYIHFGVGETKGKCASCRVFMLS